MSHPAPYRSVPTHQPTAQDVQDLVRRAEQHPLGTDYLRHGLLDSVAATFGVHAFVIDSAREHLSEGR